LPGFELLTRSLLGQLDDQLGGGPRSWSDLLIVRNVGPVLATQALDGDRVSNRGFNAILLGRDGEPSHYLKIRPAGNEAFRREARVHAFLGSHPEARHVVASGRTLLHGPMRILACEFLGGERMDVVLRKGKDEGRWSETVGAVLTASSPFWGALIQMAGGSGEGVKSTALENIALDLATLQEIGLGHEASAALGGRLVSVDLPSIPQHGDFWPRNILRVEQGWRILDLETCGEVDLPLYDVFHLIRGSVGATGGGGPGAWLASWEEFGPHSSTLRQALERHAGPLDPEQIEAALAGYLVAFTARLVRRGISRDRTAPWLKEVEMLPAVLDKGWVTCL